jgi:protein-disulfide isomerase
MKRTLIALAAVIALSAGLGYVMARSSSQVVPLAEAAGLDVPALLHDPASPVAGNLAGALTMVEFFDYRCPYCRMMQPRLQSLLKQDRKVRLVLKEWPIFGGISIYAAKVALASGWQGKFLAVHDALFALPRAMDRASVRATARGAGVDLGRLDRDITAQAAELDQMLARDDQEARALGFQGTPGFVVGKVVVPGALSGPGLRHLVAEQQAKVTAR